VHLVVVVVLPVKLTLLHEERASAGDATATDEHALCATLGYLHLGREGVMVYCT
jgi:hypothetical protein